jgi:hypothetical protein
LKSDFQLTDLNRISGTSLIRWRNPDKSSAGDFLACLWTLFGEPQSVEYEGFTYALVHIPTGLTFSAYSGGSGPAYGGFHQQRLELQPIIDEFDKLLGAVEPTDCEIKIDTDFGRYRIGYKEGMVIEEPANPTQTTE